MAGSYVRVLFVDWGNTETVHISDVRTTAPEVWRFGPIATPFKYTGKFLKYLLFPRHVYFRCLHDNFIIKIPRTFNLCIQSHHEEL